MFERYYEVRLVDFRSGKESITLAGPFESVEEAEEVVKKLYSKIIFKKGRYLGITEVEISSEEPEYKRANWTYV